MERNYGTGRRKTSTARVFLSKGTGSIVVNGKPLTNTSAAKLHAWLFASL